MFTLIKVFIWIILSCMYLLIVDGKYVMKYWAGEMGHKDGGFILSKRAKPNKMLGKPSIFSKIIFIIHNKYSLVLSYIPFFKYINRLIYILAFKMEQIPYLSIIVKILYIILSIHIIQIINDEVSSWLAIIILVLNGVIVLLLPFTSFIGDRKKESAFYKSLLFHYLIITDDVDFWTKQLGKKYSNHSMISTKNDQQNLDRRQLVDRSNHCIKDRSVFDYKTFKNAYLIHKLESFHPLYLIARYINGYAMNPYKQSGGISLYNSVDFVKVGNYKNVRSHGMMTILDYDDIVPNNLTLRKHDANEALTIRRKSNVAGMNMFSAKVFDRTHLVHHRLSGMEGGLGTLVPMYKSVNTGINSIFSGKVQKEPHYKSMKYYEDFALNYLSKHRKVKLLYYAEPFYKKNEIIPTFVDIQLYHVEKGNVFLIKKGSVYNNPYLFKEDKKFNIDVNYQTGETHIEKKKGLF